MSSVGMFGSGGARATPVSGAGQWASTPVTPVAKATAVKKLLNELFDAQQAGKTQTVQDTRDKLHALREQLGDAKFKEILNKLIDEANEGLLEFLRRLLKALFPEEDETPPGPPSVPPGGGGGGGGPSMPRSDFGPRESMSNKPITEGARYFNYKPDNSNPGKKPDNIWSGFSQGPDGNCVTVSSIKAAMMHFGQKPTDVFKEVKERGDGYDVTMRDGFKLYLSKGELQLAAREARFKGDDPQMMTDANFMYAASAKRAQIEGNSGGPRENDSNAQRSFMDALKSLNDGEHTREGLHRLGLKNHYRQGSHSDLAAGKVGTVEYSGHSMAVIGNQVELWGERGGAPRPGIVTVFV
ncbi:MULTISPECIES: hypothetical protein [Pseudomonas]|uniref:hypothetical protein n=1 Tax=Pseudomonas TaxID=286 RepID=UPI001CECA63B|nr:MULTISPECIES: hypothetical protein [Pseudomonas]